MTISVDAQMSSGLIRVTAPARLADIVSAIPGLRALRGSGNTWEGPATAATMIAVARDLAHFPDFEPTLGALDLLNEIRDLRSNVAAIKSGDWGVAYDDRLWDYQPAGVWMLLERKRALLGDDMGTGKTVMALTAARHAFPGATLVVAPNSMKHRWARECTEWFPEARAFCLDGTAKQKADIMEQVIASSDECPVVVTVNWESLATLSRISGYGSIKLSEKDVTAGPLNVVTWDCVIADEAHRAKDPKSKQTRALWFLAKEAKYRWALTGTPILNTPSDLWAIGRFYDPDTYGTSAHKWHNRYVAFLDTHFGPKDVGLAKAKEDEFTSWFDLGFIRRTKEEARLDIPEITYQVRELAMKPKQKSAYRRMEKDLIAVIDDEFLVANNSLTLLTRLSQIASATPVIEDMEVVALDMPSNKITALLEIIDELDDDKQLVIFSPSEKLITLAVSEVQRKGYTSLMRVTGKEPSAARDANIVRFQNGEIRFAFVTLGAGNEGIDLFAADTAVFLGRSYKYGESGRGKQAESRIHRAGQTAETVTVIDLVSTDTVDEEVIEALYSKGEMSEEVLRDLERQLLRSN